MITGPAGEIGTGDNGIVEEPSISAVPDGASETTVPEIVSAGPPGTRVWPSIT